MGRDAQAYGEERWGKGRCSTAVLTVSCGNSTLAGETTGGGLHGRSVNITESHNEEASLLQSLSTLVIISRKARMAPSPLSYPPVSLVNRQRGPQAENLGQAAVPSQSRNNVVSLSSCFMHFYGSFHLWQMMLIFPLIIVI